MRVNAPRLAADSASFSFVTDFIKAEPMTEDDQPKTFSYNFRNVGDKILKINRVVSMCPCVTATIDRMNIPVGEEAVISLRFSPKGYPGKFQRRVFIYTQGHEEPSAILKLGLDVDSRKDLVANYPVLKGKIRIVRDIVTFGQPGYDVETLSFINISDGPLALSVDHLLLPPCLKVEVEPKVTQPGQIGELRLIYDSSHDDRRQSGNIPVILKGLGVPPSKSSIKVIIEKQ